MEKQKNQSSDQSLLFIGVLVLMAAISQKEAQIKLWFYGHLMELAFVVFVIVALVVAKVLHTMRKKNEETINRLRAVRAVKPTRSQLDYYERKDD
jgi:membrane protein implicated in regulation of membrane protease activity